jgi:hypothetical protein
MYKTGERTFSEKGRLSHLGSAATVGGGGGWGVPTSWCGSGGSGRWKLADHWYILAADFNAGSKSAGYSALTREKLSCCCGYYSTVAAVGGGARLAHDPSRTTLAQESVALEQVRWYEYVEAADS